MGHLSHKHGRRTRAVEASGLALGSQDLAGEIARWFIPCFVCLLLEKEHLPPPSP